MKKTKRIEFTKKVLLAAKAPAKGRVILHDRKITGLVIACYPSGKKVFYWLKWVAGKAQWKTIGAFPAVTVENAREAASKINSKLEKWRGDDYQSRDPFEKREKLTLGAAIDLYIEVYLKETAKNPDYAVKEMERLRDGHLGVFKSWDIVSIRRSHIIARQLEVRRDAGLYAANRMVQMTKAVFNFLIKIEKFESANPCVAVELFQMKKRERYILPDEMPQFFQALKAETNLDLRDYVLLSLSTGARRGDIVSAKWEQFHLGRGEWTIPNPKNTKPYTVKLAKQAVNLLVNRRARVQGEYLFPSPHKSGHVLDFKKGWKGLLQRAGLTNLRPHDLRRTLASWQATQGTSLLIIGKSLGHSSLEATQIYSQVDDSAVRESVSSANASIFKTGNVSVERLLAAKVEKE